MKKDQFYADIFQIGTKENTSTVKKTPKDLLKVAMKNKARNVTMAKARKMDF